jgi:hypothetical protein
LAPAAPESWMAQLSCVPSMLHPPPLDGQRARLLRHNCEGEIGWSCVQVDNGEDGVSAEGLVASCCVGLPQGLAPEWQPPTYDVDTHKLPSVFKQAGVPLCSAQRLALPLDSCSIPPPLISGSLLISEPRLERKAKA